MRKVQLPPGERIMECNIDFRLASRPANSCFWLGNERWMNTKTRGIPGRRTPALWSRFSEKRSTRADTLRIRSAAAAFSFYVEALSTLPMPVTNEAGFPWLTVQRWAGFGAKKLSPQNRSLWLRKKRKTQHASNGLHYLYWVDHSVPTYDWRRVWVYDGRRICTTKLFRVASLVSDLWVYQLKYWPARSLRYLHYLRISFKGTSPTVS